MKVLSLQWCSPKLLSFSISALHYYYCCWLKFICCNKKSSGDEPITAPHRHIARNSSCCQRARANKVKGWEGREKQRAKLWLAHPDFMDHWLHLGIGVFLAAQTGYSLTKTEQIHSFISLHSSQLGNRVLEVLWLLWRSYSPSSLVKGKVLEKASCNFSPSHVNRLKSLGSGTVSSCFLLHHLLKQEPQLLVGQKKA